MFWAIRRFLFGVVAAAFCAGLFYVYQHRAWFRPLADLKYIYETKEPEKAKVGKWEGRVVHVFDGQTFEMSNGSPIRLRVTLTGIEAPRATPTSSQLERDIALDSSNYLKSLILSNEISAALTFSQPPLGIGLVTVGQTNVNVAVLAEGKARLNRKFIKTLPVSEQYELIRAERFARERRRGIWGVSEVSLSQ
jgi:endonuclease YncB( thermonuclease family)